MSKYTGGSIIDNLDLKKRAEERRTDYETCRTCHGSGLFMGENCGRCNGKGYVVEKQGKA